MAGMLLDFADEKDRQLFLAGFQSLPNGDRRRKTFVSGLSAPVLTEEMSAEGNGLAYRLLIDRRALFSIRGKLKAGRTLQLKWQRKNKLPIRKVVRLAHQEHGVVKWDDMNPPREITAIKYRYENFFLRIHLVTCHSADGLIVLNSCHDDGMRRAYQDCWLYWRDLHYHRPLYGYKPGTGRSGPTKKDALRMHRVCKRIIPLIKQHQHDDDLETLLEAETGLSPGILKGASDLAVQHGARGLAFLLAYRRIMHKSIRDPKTVTNLFRKHRLRTSF